MRLSQFLGASGLAAVASAQTFTNCNPMNATQAPCPNDPAMAQTFSTDFTAGADKITGWTQTAGSLKYTSEGAEFIVAKKGDSPTIQSDGYLFFGTVEVVAKAATGAGIISSIVLESDDLDEVDWEWIGVEQSTVQMNYFGKGNTTTYDRMIRANVASPMEGFHTYTLDWTSERLIYSIDGVAMRTLNYQDANGGTNFPQTPSNVRIGIWAGGDSADQGTVEWAGGKTDYSKAPFTMTIKSVKITNANPGTEYSYNDLSGSYNSIDVLGKGDTSGSDKNSAVLGASATATGAGLASASIAPTGSAALNGTGAVVTGSAAATQTGAVDTTCTSHGASSTAAPHSNGTASTSKCSCGVETVIITGYPPSSAPATSVPAIPATTVKASSTLATVPAVSVFSTIKASSGTVPPAVTVPASSGTVPVSSAQATSPPASIPPYPISTGLVTDTHSAPKPSGTVTGGIPSSGNGTATFTTGVPQFTGSGAGANMVPLGGLLAAALLFV